MGWYLTVISKSLEFTGRARRTEYWSFWLVSLLISVAFAGLKYGVGFLGNETLDHLLLNIGEFYSWAVWLPGLAVGARRMHDTDRSGWWQFVPIVGQLFLFFEGDNHENRFGPDPKAPMVSSGTQRSPQLDVPK